jgi:radical SAM superfamily enzyme YgiQ (UPF0313 family)
MIHEVHPGVPVVLGGHYATLCPDHARSFSGADVVLPGPIEESWSRLKDVPGLESLADPPPWTDIRPALNLYPRMDAAPIMTSRGCPLRCPYCASGRLYPAFEARSPGDVLDEIEKRVAIGIRHFVFFDDALLYQAEKRLIPLLEGVIARGLDIRFHAPNGLHVGSISKELARLMKRAGFETLRLGVESLDPDRQRRLGGKVAGGAFETAAERLVGAGFDPGGIGVYILFGLPGQDLDEVRGTIQAVRSVGCRPYLAEYSPLPGTPLWEEAVRVSPFDLAAEPLYQNNSFFPCRGPEFSWERIWEIKRLVKE